MTGEDPDSEDETAEAVKLDDASDRKAVRRKQNKTKFAAQEAARFWRSVFASEVGRREMWGILQATHAFETRFACGPSGVPQTEATWFHAGQQEIGQRLYHSWMRMDYAGVFQMLVEHDSNFAGLAEDKRGKK